MSNQTVILQQTNSNEVVRLICRRDDSMAIEINNQLNNSIDNYDSRTNYNGSIVMIKLHDHSRNRQHNIVYIVSQLNNSSFISKSQINPSNIVQ